MSEKSRRKQTNWLNIISLLAITIVSLVVSVLIFIIFPWRETYLFARQVNVQIGKGTLGINPIKVWKVDSGGK